MLAQLVESLAIQFSTEMTEQDPNCSMSNFIFSLFIIILIDETVELCINKLFENKDTDKCFPNLLFREVLSLATKTFAMVSHLGIILVNAFLSHHKQNSIGCMTSILLLFMLNLFLSKPEKY